MTLSTPYYLVDEGRLKRNLEILRYVKEQTHCHILLASKAFSMYHTFPLIGEYLDGVTSSGLYEAKLGYEEMGKEVHTFACAYKPQDMDELLTISDHIVFNSLNQWEMHRAKAIGKVSCGLRINPEYSEIETELYDPCAPYSRMGITKAALQGYDLCGIDGLHMHTMCEQGADTLARTTKVLCTNFHEELKRMKWLNLGGGHHITKPGYDIDVLIDTIRYLQDTYQVEVYLEPGEAVAYHAGFLIGQVLDIVENGKKTAILDVSAACHMPDVLEMPYRPPLLQSAEAGVYPYTYRLAGNTCLAGDIIGEYSFQKPLVLGDTLVFEDMAIYTMVKNNTFNGIPLPAIAYRHENGTIEVVKRFDYDDYKRRL